MRRGVQYFITETMKKKITEEDYIKANRRASREEEIRAHGKPPGRHHVHKSKKIYDRKKSKAGLRDLPFLIVRSIDL